MKRKDLPLTVIAARYQAGEGFAALGEAFDVSPETVRRALLDAGVPIRPRGLSPDLVAAARQRRREIVALAMEAGAKEAARMFNVSERRVTQIVARDAHATLVTVTVPGGHALAAVAAERGESLSRLLRRVVAALAAEPAIVRNLVDEEA